MDGNNILNDSDDYDSLADDIEKPTLKGVLTKWTNYIHGWQDRFVCCKGGQLFYYRSEDETEYACRGSLSLAKASVISNELDSCRFDICVNNDLWYLRASDESERQQWIDVIEANKSEDDAGLQRHGSLVSLGSGPSITSTSSFRKAHHLKTKLAELETFKDILDSQVDILQQYFDECANIAQPLDSREHWVGGRESDGEPNRLLIPHHSRSMPPEINGIDFKGEAITFKATTAGIQATLAHCIDLMSKRDEMWQRKLEKEHDKRKKAEEHYRVSLEQTKKSHSFLGSPDFEEGPQSSLTEEEFFDAVEYELEKREKFTLNIERCRNKLREAELHPKQNDHRFKNEIQQHVDHHLSESLTPPGMDGDVWDLLAKEGEMKVFRRELIRDGIILDPLKAIHSVGRVTAREVCHYFWKTDVRMEWENTVENFNVVEVVDEKTVIVYQTHRRIWPSAQRDCLYLSTMLKIDNPPAMRDGTIPHDTWMVCNFSVDHKDVKPVSGCVRAVVEIVLICQTKVTPPAGNGPLTRDCLTCDLTYIAHINPGGWAPATVLRTIYKREYPKFLRSFTAYIRNQTKDKEILF